MDESEQPDGARNGATVAAVALAAIIFVADILPDFQAAVSILYVAVQTLGTWRRGRHIVIVWTAICVALSLAAFLFSHPDVSEVPALLRLAFAIVAMLITGALLISRIELQKARAAQQASELNAENFMNTVPQILWRGYPDGSCDYINERMEELTGCDFPPGEREKRWPENVHADDREQYLGVMMAAFEARREFRFAFRMKSVDGGYRRCITIGRPAPNPHDPNRIAYYGGISDVHAEFEAQEQVRRLAETLEQRVEERTAALTRSEHRFRSLFFDMNIAFAETDTSVAKELLEDLRASGVTDLRAYAAENPDVIARCVDGIRLVDVNDAVANMLGFVSSEDLTPLPRSEFLEDPGQALFVQLEAIFEGKRRSTGSGTFVRKDGSRILVAFQVNYPSDWTYGLVTYVDISEQQRAHELVLAATEELARANRVATVGALSSSLAHELNQPITALSLDSSMCVRMLEQEQPNTAEALKAARRLTRNVDRMSEIVRRTRQQVVKRDGSTQEVDFCDTAREVHLLLQRDLHLRGATLHIRCNQNIPMVAANKIEMQQVLINLVMNAADAMADISDRDRLIVLSVTSASRDEVVVTVSDNGPGIAEADRVRIFQPFFTTKPDGMGMGLQICRSLIEAFGGILTIHDSEEGGAAFRFRLPSAQAMGAAAEAARVPTATTV